MGFNNNLFKKTFLISLILHSLIFVPIPRIKLSTVSAQANPLPLVTYFNIKIPEEIKKHSFAAVKEEEKELIKAAAQENQKVVKKFSQSIPESQINKENKSQVMVKKDNPVQNTPAVKIEEKKQVITRNNTIVNSELSANKLYLNYYTLINERLRQSIIYPRYFSEGEITLSFVITADGTLKSIEIIPQGSAENSVLRETALQIVKNASPFPPFPADLRRMQLTFNVVICFREKS